MSDIFKHPNNPPNGIISNPENKIRLGTALDCDIDRNELTSNFDELRNTQIVTETGKIKYQDAKTINVPEFDIHTLPDFGGVTIVGASESGKSNWLTWGLVQNNHLPWYQVFTQTAANGDWQKYLPMHAVIKGFDVDRAANILSHQSRVLDFEDTHNIKMGIICDDLQGTRAWVGPMTELYTRGRHFKIQPFILVQTKNGAFKHIRLNTKLVVVFRVLSHQEKVEVAKQWMGDWNLQTAVDLLSIYTSKHHGLCIDARTSPPKLYVTKAANMKEIAKKKGFGKRFQVFIPLGSKSFWDDDPRPRNTKTNFAGDLVSQIPQANVEASTSIPGNTEEEPNQQLSQIQRNQGILGVMRKRQNTLFRF